MIRTVDVKEITENIREMCIAANHVLSPDMGRALNRAVRSEESPLGRQILGQLEENLEIAAEEMIPICQDTGMAVIFLEVGQDVHLEGGSLEDAVNEGVRRGYADGFLRKSVVKDPLIRENTKDNTPAVIHTRIVPGEEVKITVAPKGFGSENMSRIFMLKPAEGIEGVKQAVLTAVKDAGPNACPPMVVGVGIGGTFEKCALLAKEALTREAGSHSSVPYIKDMEEELIDRFGDSPKKVGTLLEVAALKARAHKLYVTTIEQKGDMYTFTMYEHAKVQPERIPKLIELFRGSLTFRAENYTFVYVHKIRNKREKPPMATEIVAKVLDGIARILVQN